MGKRQLWPDERIEKEIRAIQVHHSDDCFEEWAWQKVYVCGQSQTESLLESIRDDLQAALDKRTHTCHRLLRVNGELRAENERLRAELVAEQRLSSEIISELQNDNYQLEMQLAAGEWIPVLDKLECPNELSIAADEMAVTIGHGKTAMATACWPDDGREYAVCWRNLPAGGDDANPD